MSWKERTSHNEYLQVVLPSWYVEARLAKTAPKQLKKLAREKLEQCGIERDVDSFLEVCANIFDECMA